METNSITWTTHLTLFGSWPVFTCFHILHVAIRGVTPRKDKGCQKKKKKASKIYLENIFSMLLGERGCAKTESQVAHAGLELLPNVKPQEIP